jgi:hypothetical protein
MAGDLRRFRWGGEDLNLRPTDHEFHPARFPDQAKRGNLPSGLRVCLIKASRCFATFRGRSRDKCGTSKAEAATKETLKSSGAGISFRGSESLHSCQPC